MNAVAMATLQIATAQEDEPDPVEMYFADAVNPHLVKDRATPALD